MISMKIESTSRNGPRAARYADGALALSDMFTKLAKFRHTRPRIVVVARGLAGMRGACSEDRKQCADKARLVCIELLLGP